MKTCFKCGETKPSDAFYAHKMMADGLLGKCKACTKADVLRHRLANVERCRAWAGTFLGLEIPDPDTER